MRLRESRKKRVEQALLKFVREMLDDLEEMGKLEEGLAEIKKVI